MLLQCRNQNIDLHSELLDWILHNSNTGLKIAKLNSAKNAITHVFVYVMNLVELSISISSHDVFRSPCSKFRILKTLLT